MYYNNINIDRILANKKKHNTAVCENSIKTISKTDEDINTMKEKWLDEICEKYTPVSIFEASVSNELDKMIDSIVDNPLNIKEYNKFISKVRLDKIKLSSANVKKLLKFNTELIVNPEVKLVDKKSVENIVNLPVILSKEIVSNGKPQEIAVYKKILEKHRVGLDSMKDITKEDSDLLKAFNKSIKDSITLLSNVKSTKESFNTINDVYDNTVSGTYLERLFEFEFKTVDLFLDDNDITLEQFQDYMRTAIALENTEMLMEAGKVTNASRKVTQKIQTGVRRLDQKTNGNRETVGKNVKRVDKTLSDFLNKKYDDIINIGRDDKREKLITGKVSIKLGKLLKTTIMTIVGGTGAKIALGPVGGTLATIVGLMGAYACSKKTEVREKKRILLELETEHRIVSEKIEDAKGENDKKQKYELMRVQAKLEKEITRIKYNLRYY